MQACIPHRFHVYLGPVSISPQLKSQFAISIDIMKRPVTTCVTVRVCVCVCVRVHVLQKVQILVISSCVWGECGEQREKRVANVSCHVCQRAPPVDHEQPTIIATASATHHHPLLACRRLISHANNVTLSLSPLNELD